MAQRIRLLRSELIRSICCPRLFLAIILHSSRRCRPVFAASMKSIGKLGRPAPAGKGSARVYRAHTTFELQTKRRRLISLLLRIVSFCVSF